jgi:hypothetical protein
LVEDIGKIMRTILTQSLVGGSGQGIHPKDGSKPLRWKFAADRQTGVRHPGKRHRVRAGGKANDGGVAT